MKLVKSYVISILGLFLFLQGCSTKIFNERIEVASTTKIYNNFTKDEVLNAAKRVFRITDKNQFIIDSYRNKISVSKIKANYEILSLNLYEDKIDLSVDENNQSVRAFLSMKRVIGLDKTKEKYFSNDLHQFFWQRIDYILGIRKTWPKCVSRYIDFDLVLNTVLCDPIDLDNHNPLKEDNLNLSSKEFDKKNYSFNSHKFEKTTTVTKDDVKLMIDNGERIGLLRDKKVDPIKQISAEVKIVDLIIDENINSYIKDEKENISVDVKVTDDDISTIILNGKQYLEEKEVTEEYGFFDAIIDDRNQPNSKDILIIESQIIED